MMTHDRIVPGCSNPDCTCENCTCGDDCSCGKGE